MRLAARTRHHLSPLEEPYRSRALPPGSVRYWSWLFASREARDPLLAMYALMAEWRALMDPNTETSVARIKLEWWREETRRLADNTPAHPITRYVAEMPLASVANLASLEQSVLAAAAQVAGAPLERANDLAAHSFSLCGIPLQIAGQLAGQNGVPKDHSLRLTAGIANLAAAEYLLRAVAEYPRDIRVGRIAFPVDELLAAHIEDADLAAKDPPPPLREYLLQLRKRAAGYLADATRGMSTIPPQARSRHRHLSIVAALGLKHVNAGRTRYAATPSSADFRLSDLYNAWSTARRAARGDDLWSRHVDS